MTRLQGIAALLASLPFCATIASAQYAYVANLNDNNVTVVNTATNAVVTTIPVGTTPFGVAASPDGKTIYVANINSLSVSVISTATNQVTGAIKVSGQPYGLAVSPDGTLLYVTNHSGTNITVVNTSNNSTSRLVTVGGIPYEVVFQPSGANAYVANNASSTVTVIRTSDFSTTTLTTGNQPAGLAVTPSGAALYVANYNDNTVSVFDTSKSTNTATINVGNYPRGVAAHPNGKQIWVTNQGDGTISVIDVASNTVTATINVGNSPVLLAFNSTGSFAYVANGSDNTLGVVDTVLQQQVATVNTGGNPTGVAIGGPPISISVNAAGIVNAASLAPKSSVAPGSLAAVFGSFPVVASTTNASPWPVALGGLSMKFNSTAAPLYFAGSTQANVQVPWEMAGQTTASVIASAGSTSSAAQSATIASVAPGLFALNGSGSGQGAIVDNASGKVVDSTNPAKHGTSILQIYATGLGAVSNQPATGAPASLTQFSNTTLTPSVTIGGVDVGKPLFSGLAPGFIGLYQVNVQVPAGVQTGSAVPVQLTINGVQSNTVTIAVN